MEIAFGPKKMEGILRNISPFNPKIEVVKRKPNRERNEKSGSTFAIECRGFLNGLSEKKGST